MLDYHVHLWPHPERAEPFEQSIERLSAYCARAGERGVEEIALTEHLFRFKEAVPLLEKAVAAAAGSPFAAPMTAYFDHHATASLDEYVEAVLEARHAGLPVRLGLEVDFHRGRMDDVATLLAGYPFDVLLGSVHWLGPWMFDVLDEPVQVAEWSSRGTEAAWRDYTEALEELAASRTCDVLAHPDLVKVAGHRPDQVLLDECHDRMAEAAARTGMAAEISSAGWRKPCAEAYPSPALLRRFRERQVPITTASDTHGMGAVAERAFDLAALARAAGYESVRAFRGRVGLDRPFETSAAPDSAS